MWMTCHRQTAALLRRTIARTMPALNCVVRSVKSPRRVQTIARALVVHVFRRSLP